MNQLHFNTRIIRPGESYGVDDSVKHEDNNRLGALIEFYDPRYTGEGFTPLGQFVTRYYVGSLLADADNLTTNGLCLDGGVPAWSVDGPQMAGILYTTREQLK